MFHLCINKKKSNFVQPYALHGYKSLYVHPDIESRLTIVSREAKKKQAVRDE